MFLQISSFLCLLSFFPFISAGDISKHEAGRCAIRGHCGKQGFFGKPLPCPDNGLATLPSDETRAALVKICGSKWSEGPVCCNDEQIESLSSNLKTAAGIIEACPACKENFFNLFCTFTCSPDQSTFVNVTETDVSDMKKTVVTELDNLWSNKYGSDFYDSCKDVKLGATGGTAMAFIGGGAKNYTDFLKFLGDKKPFVGSPFQINFPRPIGREIYGMRAADPITRACNDSDEAYRCACVDCPASCEKLPEISLSDSCSVGVLPCLSFASILVYSIGVLLLAAALIGHMVIKKYSRRQNERLRLLQETEQSDDEDEGRVLRARAALERPQKEYLLNSLCDQAFHKLGKACASAPLITITISVVVVIFMSLGWMNFEIERDPVRLWVSPSSAAAEEKQFFDANFGPFYRAEQAFLVNDTQSAGPGPVLSYEILKWWSDVENRVSKITTLDGETTFADVCFDPTGDACVVQSPLGYFDSQASSLKPGTWEAKLKYCTTAPTSCLPAFHQPLEPAMVLGGWQESGDILQSQALITTWVLSNHKQGSKLEVRAMAWELQLKALMLSIQSEAESRGLRLSFTTESSLEEELNQTTNTDANIVIISYVVMFIYASLALGSASLSVKSILNNPSNLLVQSKFSLGVSGIVIVLMSVSASVGVFSAAGIKVTLIIAEVIPFLVLAVGVDNIFLIVHEFERVNKSYPDEEIENRVAKSLGRMGPSILLSASAETVAFSLGAFVGMPAVRNFAIYAAGAVLINALLQVTLFVAVLALNQRRVESNRVDCFPCLQVKGADGKRTPAGTGFEGDDEGTLQRFIRKVYAPMLLDRRVKVGVVVLFLGFFAAGLALIPEVALGLDQRIAIPTGSYLIPYFNDLYQYYGSGPPVYFVTRDLNLTEKRHQQQVCGRFTTCNTFSLANVLEQESKRSDLSYISGSTASWVDDFLFWLNPHNEQCCKEGGQVCFEDRSPPWNVTLHGMPEGAEFIHYVSKWLESPTDEECPLGGQAPYSTALVVDEQHSSIPASHFRTMHTPLRGQDDFIAAYASARRIADDISRKQGISVFPYSKFYIFFDQYATIVRLTGTLLGSATALIFFISSLLLGSLATGAIVTLTVIMTVTDILGTMALAHVSLNAVSLVNLIICIGIAVEFCAHIARAFMFPSKPLLDRATVRFVGGTARDARVWAALVNVGGSVFSGITVTKLLGVSVLAFTRSKIFEVYYFRVWLALVVWAATHALVFLPVALSLMGGEGYIDAASEGTLEEDLTSRRERSLMLNDDYDSDDD